MVVLARRPWLAGSLAIVTVLALLAGCTDFDEHEQASNRIGILGVDVAAPVVTAGSVTLEVRVTLDNLAARSGELNLTVKAYDQATGMLVQTARQPVGEMRADQSKEVILRLVVPRDAGYRLETVLEQDGRFVQRAQVTASNLQALEPTEYDTGLGIEGIDVEVVASEDGRVRLRCPVYLTNEAGTASRELRLQLKAREVSTGILADEQWTEVETILPDNTRAQTVTLEVPDGYNYELQAFLWDGEVVVERGLGKVQLLPTYTAPADQKIVVTKPDIGAFIDRDLGFAPGGAYEGGYYDDEYARQRSSDDGDSPTPGAALPLLVAALAGAVLILRRKTA